MDSVRRIVASFLAAVFLAGALAAQTVQVQANELILHAYALKYRQAGEAVSLVSPLLSRAGTVELQPGSNTLVIRDTPASLNKITMVLRSYDQPARPVILELYIVRASRSQVSPPTPRSDLPEPLTRGLRSLLAYDIFETQAQAQLISREGQSVTYTLSEDYEVSFRLGTLSADRLVKLADLRIQRRTGQAAVPLLYYDLVNLRLDQPKILGLAKSESSPVALMFVLTLHSGNAARRLPRREP
jgi:hypothetical protein